jgi:hypothetical protein
MFKSLRSRIGRRFLIDDDRIDHLDLNQFPQRVHLGVVGTLGERRTLADDDFAAAARVTVDTKFAIEITVARHNFSAASPVSLSSVNGGTDFCKICLTRSAFIGGV